jgi:hypothetical protein
MSRTLLIKVHTPEAEALLKTLEEQHLISVIATPEQADRPSKRFRSMLSSKQAESLNRHVKKIRSEWETI